MFFSSCPLNCHHLDLMIYWNHNCWVVLFSVISGQVTASWKCTFFFYLEPGGSLVCCAPYSLEWPVQMSCLFMIRMLMAFFNKELRGFLQWNLSLHSTENKERTNAFTVFLKVTFIANTTAFLHSFTAICDGKSSSGDFYMARKVPLHSKMCFAYCCFT